MAWDAPADTTAFNDYQSCIKDTASASCADANNDWDILLGLSTVTEGMIDDIGDASLTLGETYYVRLRTFDNTNGVGGTATDAIKVQTGPAAVTMLAATAGHQSVTLEWTDDGQGVTHYEYRYKAGTNDWVKGPDSDTATAYTYTVTGLNNKTEYTFQVRAYIKTETPAVDAPGGAGEEVTATPGTPEAVAFMVTTGFERARFDFVAPTDLTITGYEYRVAPDMLDAATVESSLWKWVQVDKASLLEFTSDGNSMLALLVSQTTGAKATDTDPATAAADLMDGAEYKFNLRAVNGSGAGPANMDDVEGTPTASTSNVPVPQDLTASPGNGSVTLDWDAVTGYAGVGYQYCQKITMGGTCEDADGDWLPIPESNLETTDYEVTDLINKATLYFKLRSISNAEEPATDTPPRAEVSDPSDEVSAVVGAPARPTGLKAVIGNAKFRLNWTTPANNGSAITAYEYSTDGGSTWKEIVDSGPSTVMALITEQSSSTDGLPISMTYS